MISGEEPEGPALWFQEAERFLRKGMPYSDWREYQTAAAVVFRHLGCDVKVEHDVAGVRSRHKIDVHATFVRSGILCTWIVECKLWNSRVSKDVVLTLRTIVDDVGADRGIIISEMGFQSGAQEAARGTNITLVTSLEEFERTAIAASTETALVLDPSESGAPIYKFLGQTGPRDLVCWGDFIITANWAGSGIGIVNPETKTMVRTIDLDKYESISPLTGKREIRTHPAGSLVVADGRLFVGQVFSDVVIVIDLATLSIVKRIQVPGGGEGELAVSPDEKTVYFASNRLNQFYIIDSATYEFTTVAYPLGGRGCMSMLRHPSRDLLYIGISRGGRIDGLRYPHANSFLAIYDLARGCYVGDCQLAEVVNGMTDDATPACITYDEIYKRVYIGMFQSMRGIVVIDEASNHHVCDIRIRRNNPQPVHPWTDPLCQAVDGDDLVSVVRNNRELAILDRKTFQAKKLIDLGEAPNGPSSAVIWRRQAIVSYPERNGLIFVPLDGVDADAVRQPWDKVR